MPSTINPLNTCPFPQGYRASGMLLHATSLPSPYGIGDLGPGAYSWVDRLAETGQTWWQALPLGPTGYGDSPYQCLSSFAGNGLLISPEYLIEDGLLTADECRGIFSSTEIDYHTVIPYKHRLLKLAWARFRAGERGDLVPAYEEFCQDRASWLEDYALFRALKTAHGGAPYYEWPHDLMTRVPSAIVRARYELADDIDEVRFAQFLLNRQAGKLKEYARSKGIRLIGDLPFFVAPDSSDVWANPELFLLDEHLRPRVVAGVPPDYFSTSGQLWGNPVYNWAALEATGYSWWIDRLRALLAHVDLVRLDHFRAFAAAWHIPAGAPTAKSGEWVPGPGAAFFNSVRDQLGVLPFIAEDLGVITPDVTSLRDRFQIPGTRVLQFAFDDNPENPHLPHHYSHNLVAYPGTHDNAPTRQWFEELSEAGQQCLWDYVGRVRGEPRNAAPELIRLAWLSPAALAIAPLQDLLNLGEDGRMNLPGSAAGNWRWRATSNMLRGWNFHWLRDLTRISKRSAQSPAMEATS
ncbi:MAG: 4-alpha-glucanotransferase [Candidatus Solibacter sp.]